MGQTTSAVTPLPNGTNPHLGVGYAPIHSACPATSLLRPAAGLSASEEAYRIARKAKADVSLKSWLLEQDADFRTDRLPTVALTTSGGGYRSLLTGAGVIQGLDGRDSNVSTSGLFQGLTYQAGLSGGSWLLSSFAAHNYPTITSLKEGLWEEAFENTLLDPGALMVLPAYFDIVSDLIEKGSAGYETTLTDIWGRLLSYQLLNPTDGGISTTLSSIANSSNFSSHSVPFPVITSLGVKTWLGQCNPGPNATTYESTPYEFGSWDSDVSAFIQTKYLGTSLRSGRPTENYCTTNFDNLGLILGTSSSLFNQLCNDVPEAQNSSTNLDTTMAQQLDYVHSVGTADLYGQYPNPFYGYVSKTSVQNSANNVSAQAMLSLVDGGEALQNNPIFPFLQPARKIDVILVNDNSADTGANYPNGSEILTTYIQSLNHNLTRMPYIPPVATFLAQNLSSRATIFGCGDASKTTIIYLPNHNFTYASGISTAQLQYPRTETVALIANGVQVMAQNGTAGWGTCLGCAIMMKTSKTLPKACGPCLDEYCYSDPKPSKNNTTTMTLVAATPSPSSANTSSSSSTSAAAASPHPPSWAFLVPVLAGSLVIGMCG